MHVHELSGPMQATVFEYRKNKHKYEQYHELVVDLYHEELKMWINENKIIDLNLRCVK